MSVFKDLLWFFKQEKRSYLWGISLLVVVAILELLPPKVIGYVIDEMVKNSLNSKNLLFWVSLIFINGLLLYAFRYWWRRLIFGSSLKLARQLRDDLYNHFTKMSPSFYQKNRIGDLMAHATNDVQAVRETAGAGILTFVDSIILGGSVLIMMAVSISWKLTLISLLPLPVMAILTQYYGKLLHQRFHLAQESFSELNNKVQESMSGLKVIRSLGQTKEDVGAFKNQADLVVKYNMRVASIDALFDPTIMLVVSICYIIAVVYGSRLVISDTITVGQLITFVTYLGILIWPMLAIGWLFNIVERGRASYDRIRSLLSVEPEIKNKEKALEKLSMGEITYSIDSFKFNDESNFELNDIYFNVQEGQTIGIVGKTGQGKTTLLKLLLREYEVANGGISVGDIDIKDTTLLSLRSHIGYVPQEHFLFSTSIKENIAFSQIDSSIETVYKAAEIANIHADILEFPLGYDTIVGERGVSLSGGQKQRISIARSLIKNPNILILDDCLSAVDAKTEEKILRSLKDERSGKTTFITSHRMSAVMHSDLIIVIDEGRIIQRGMHEELVQIDGWYKEMFERQQLEELVEQGGRK
ncbi:ABC transporter transmembrane domain-containing protein [Bacillus sp. AFS017336]|uniref:ABC transporter transmembrane domain-containing protein n=1 Tax=Bacillus sp. AFS017336 TaxID=2033489 RepID=UPI000BEF27A7|nr:ABC transporter transmembrane domain-containing protein [Bacillus sp. AFS017336]PEL13809.1 ABC transporter ATP-binding protein [Bacillus sp. AFS017336]